MALVLNFKCYCCVPVRFWFSYEDRRDTDRRFETDPQDLRHSLISRRRSDITDRLDDRRDEQRPDVR